MFKNLRLPLSLLIHPVGQTGPFSFPERILVYRISAVWFSSTLRQSSNDDDEVRSTVEE